MGQVDRCSLYCHRFISLHFQDMLSKSVLEVYIPLETENLKCIFFNRENKK